MVVSGVRALMLGAINQPMWQKHLESYMLRSLVRWALFLNGRNFVEIDRLLRHRAKLWWASLKSKFLSFMLMALDTFWAA
jgi:hypothetical protein